jgi:hypothetical protein
MKKESELLIDWIYRGTFKRPRNPDLRQVITQARRCVLSDEMAAFMYTMMVEILAGNRPAGCHWQKRCVARLDDCRWFSRLPHRVTWVEYSLGAMYERELSDRRKSGDHRVDGEQHKLQLTKSAGTRIGWLLQQHDHIDTAFRAQYFLGVPNLAASHYRSELLWCTDDTPLPWSTIALQELAEQKGWLYPEDDTTHLISSSEFVTGVRGYNRSNVGFRWRDGQSSPTPRQLSLEGEMSGLHGRARMMWCFLSMFNKVPIIGEHRIVPSHGFVAQGRYHRFLEHKIITVNVPEKAGIRKVAREAISIIRRRAHQVRGHWRDDWRMPKGNKALWIAEHQRGDASIGFVTHDYSVEHKQP